MGSSGLSRQDRHLGRGDDDAGASPGTIVLLRHVSRRRVLGPPRVATDAGAWGSPPGDVPTVSTCPRPSQSGSSNEPTAQPDPTGRAQGRTSVSRRLARSAGGEAPERACPLPLFATPPRQPARRTGRCQSPKISSTRVAGRPRAIMSRSSASWADRGSGPRWPGRGGRPPRRPGDGARPGRRPGARRQGGRPRGAGAGQSSAGIVAAPPRALSRKARAWARTSGRR